MSGDRSIEIEFDPAEAFAIVPLWLVRHSEVGDRAIRLYATLAGYADNTTGRCWPSRARLAADMACSTDSVDRAARELMLAGAVTVQHRYDDAGNRLPNLWTIHRVQKGGRTGAATPSRRAAAPLAAPVRHRTRPNELETPHADARAVSESAETEQPQSGKDSPVRKRDRLTPYRDALLAAFNVDPSTIVGKRGWGPWNAAARDLADAGVDPSQVGPMLIALRKRDAWRDRITPIVLVQEWATLIAESKPAQETRRVNVTAAITLARTFTEADDLAEDVIRRLRTAGLDHPDEIRAALDAVGLSEEVAA